MELRFYPGPARNLSTIAECTVNRDDGQKNCPKHVEFHAGVNLGN